MPGNLIVSNRDDGVIAVPCWRDALAESEADLRAGRIVPGEAVLRDLRDSLARLAAKPAATTPRKATPRR